MALGFSISGGLDTVPVAFELLQIHRSDKRTIRLLAKAVGLASGQQPTNEDLGSFDEPRASCETRSIGRGFGR